MPFLFLFIVIVLGDQLSKYWALQTFAGAHQEVIPGMFNLVLVMNPGAAFGIFSSFPDETRRIALIAVSLVALMVVLRLLLVDSKGDKVSQFALVSILGGAVGNVIDRVRFDSVVDFLDFYWNNYHWPAFNVADSCICVGVAVLAFRMLFPQATAGTQGKKDGDSSSKVEISAVKTQHLA